MTDPGGLVATHRWPAPGPPAPELLAMVDALRDLQDDLTGAVAPAEVVADAAATLAGLAAELRRYAVPEPEQVVGRLPVPGRGQTMAPVVHVEEAGAGFTRGHVTLGRFYLGRNGAAHGGAVPLLFDEILGRLANADGRTPSRTAFLHVDYRSITPVGVRLRFAARIDREEGRKRFLRATLHAGDTLCAEAGGLFVALRPGQP